MTRKSAPESTVSGLKFEVSGGHFGGPEGRKIDFFRFRRFGGTIWGTFFGVQRSF